MKLIIFLTAISVSIIAFAQQAPQAPQHTDRSRAPLGQAPGEPHSPGASQELKDLMHAQTEAIKALSNRVDALEDRLGKIESKER
ncbi:MAG: hypothetical protein MN733_08215 [Nitrososphaera sp.]|nr:hypothetical protein [Nitrososphaera sp.]